MIHKVNPTGCRHLPAAERREQIARVALDLIAQGGLKDLSMAAVARRLGLVPSAIYRHFRSKDEIIDAVLDLIGAQLERNVQAATRETDDPLDALARLLALHVELIRATQAIPRLIFSDEVHWRRPERKRRVHAILARYLAHVAELVRAGQSAGRIRSDLEPETAGFMYLGLIQPAGVLWYLTDGRFDVTRQVRKAWGVLAAAIEAPPAPRARARARARGRGRKR
jgi:AcrR family transcriptional regulator